MQHLSTVTTEVVGVPGLAQSILLNDVPGVPPVPTMRICFQHVLNLGMEFVHIASVPRYCILRDQLQKQLLEYAGERFMQSSKCSMLYKHLNMFWL